MKIKKIFIALTFILLVTILLSACSSTNNSQKEETQSSTISDTIVTTEAQTVAQTEQAIYKIEDFVKTVMDCDYNGSGLLQITGEKGKSSINVKNRFPQLTIDSDDALEINKDINSKYSEMFGEMCDSEYAKSNSRFDYQAYINNNVLSLVIERSTTGTPNSHFDVYNLDINTKSKLSKNETVSFSNISIEDANEQIKKILTDKFENSEATDENIIKEPREKSLSEDNINKAQYYFNEKGKLVAAYRYYWYAGADTYGEISVLDAHISK